MNFYIVSIDWGKKKRFACGCLEEVFNFNRTICLNCGIEIVAPNNDQLFEDKTWNVKMYMDRCHYADFINSQIRKIVSERAKEVLIDHFNNAVDFADIEMISLRDLTAEKLKAIRDWSGYTAVKKIPNDPPQYFRLLLKQGADLDFEKSNVELVLNCPTCGRKDYKHPIGNFNLETNETTWPPIYIIESSWKGYDIFYIEGKGNTVFCTERFFEIYSQNKLTGLEFRQISVS